MGHHKTVPMSKTSIDAINAKEVLGILGYRAHKSLYTLEKKGLLTPLRHPHFKNRRYGREEVEALAKMRRENWKK